MKTLPPPPETMRCFFRTPPTAALLLALSTFCATGLTQAQMTFTYTPSTIYTPPPSTPPIQPYYLWTTSGNWGLGAGEYPNESGAVVNLSRISTSAILSFSDSEDPANYVEPTFGVLNIGPLGTGTGSAAWTIGRPVAPSQQFILDNGTSAAVIHNTSGSTVNFRAAAIANNGISLTGSHTIAFYNNNTRFEGGITIEGGGHVYFHTAEMIADSVVTLASAGSARFGNATATKRIIHNDFVVTDTTEPGTSAARRGIYSNSTSGIELHGNISGNAGLILGTDNSARNDVTGIFGSNTYQGTTEIRTHVVFHSIENFGQGSIEFTSADRRLTHAANNTADITTNYLGDVRAVALNRQTTIDTGGNSVTYANAISGTAGLTKAGSGSLTLLGNNTFLNTVVSEGTLVAGHRNAFGGGTGSLTMAATARLEVQAGTALEIGTLSLESTTQFTFNLTQPSDPASLTVMGNQSGNSELFITIAAGSGSPTAGDYLLLSFLGDTGELSFTLAPESEGLGSLDWNQETRQLTFHAIPEPNTALLFVMAIGAAGLALKRNRQ